MGLWSRNTSAALVAALATMAVSGVAMAQKSLIVHGGSAVPAVVYLPIYVADKAGFFAAEGLTVDLRYTQGGALATQLVANNNADLAHIVWQPAIAAHTKGAKGKFVYQTYTRQSFFMATLPDSPIKEPKDLVGKKIGVFNMASPGVFVARSTARAGGVQPNQISFFPVGLGAQALTALKGGMVDAIELWDSEYANYEAIGEKLRYIPHPTLGGIGNGGFYASEQAIANKKPALASFTRAIAQGTAYLLANPQSALRMYWEVAPSAKPQGDEREAIRRGITAVRFVAQTFSVESRLDKRFGTISSASVQAFIDALREEGELKEEVKAEAMIDTQFIDYANDFDMAAARKPR